jgi:hypothetical protein
MGLNTKIKIDDNHVEQLASTTLTLNSGATTQYSAHPTFTEDTQVVDKKYVDDNIVSGVTASTVYQLGSPATVTVGGVTIGDTLTGLTSNQILEDILYPDIIGELTGPSMVSVVLSVGTPQEVGTPIAPDVTATFDRGSIDPKYCSASADRSGAPLVYCFTGPQIQGTPACSTDVSVQSVSNYTVTAGTNTWGSCTCHSIGVQPKDNKDVNYDSPLAAALVTPAVSATITGIYPFFYGVSVGVPTPGSDLLTGGTTCVVDSDGTIAIGYGLQTDKYLWFAIPTDSTTKQGWIETNNNNGNIGEPSDLFGAQTIVSVDSPDSCWSGQDFKFYVSNYVTSIVTTLNDYCMTNTPQQ